MSFKKRILYFFNYNFYTIHLFLSLVLLVYLNEYFGSDLPLRYKIFKPLASHEGSWFILIFSYILVSWYVNKTFLNLDNKFEILNKATIVLLDLSLIWINDFGKSKQVDLNPLLQDYGLIIHPPLLYLSYALSFWSCGYAMTNIIFAESASDLKLKPIINIVRLSWIINLIAVALGSHWAYRELGWGGYWFYDPIENLSLMILVSLTCFYHVFVITIKTGRLLRLSFITAACTWGGIIVSLFLSRSGLLVSVHTFMTSVISPYVLYVLIVIFASLIIIGTFRIKEFNNSSSNKTLGIAVGTSISILEYSMLLIATVFPIIYEQLYNQTISINQDFFITFINPQVIPILILMGLFVKDKKLYGLSLITGSMIGVINYIFGFNIYLSAGLFCILNSLALMKTKVSGMLISHLGFGLLVLSISINQMMSQDFMFHLSEGESQVFQTGLNQELRIELLAIEHLEKENFYIARPRLKLNIVPTSSELNRGSDSIELNQGSDSIELEQTSTSDVNKSDQSLVNHSLSDQNSGFDVDKSDQSLMNQLLSDQVDQVTTFDVDKLDQSLVDQSPGYNVDALNNGLKNKFLRYLMKLIQIESEIILLPELRVYKPHYTPNFETFVKNFLFYDIYAVYEGPATVAAHADINSFIVHEESFENPIEHMPKAFFLDANKANNSDHKHMIKVSYKSFMMFIWISVLIMAIGALKNLNLKFISSFTRAK